MISAGVDCGLGCKVLDLALEFMINLLCCGLHGAIGAEVYIRSRSLNPKFGPKPSEPSRNFRTTPVFCRTEFQLGVSEDVEKKKPKFECPSELYSRGQ